MEPPTDKTLARQQQAALELGLDRARRHIFLCVDVRAEKCASRKQLRAAWSYLKRRLEELDLERAGVLRTRSGCLRICRGGPIAVVYPEGAWYGGCDPETLERIVCEHLVGGRIVGEHLIALGPLAGCVAEGRPSSSLHPPQADGDGRSA